MLQKNILAYVKKKRNVTFSQLYKELNAETNADKKAIKKNIQQLQDNKKINIHTKSGNISLFEEKRTDKRMGGKRKGDFQKNNTLPLRFTEHSIDDFSLIREKYQLPSGFERIVLDELEKKQAIQESMEQHRVDLRNLFVITIDGADSKDLDDAVSVSKSLFGSWELGVHIADVSYYVRQNSALDKEALERGNSYYFVNKVIPMLPERLSNQLCSLNPHEDKKSMSIFMTINNKGDITKYKIVPSIIKSSYRMTYSGVEEIIQGASHQDPKLVKNIKLMDKLFRILNQKRKNKGSVDFNFKEKKIELDEKDFPIKIYQKDRLDSERLIEEFMLAANQVAGEFLTKNGMGLYRVHDIPPSEKYQRLRNFASKRGHKLPNVPTPKDLQEFIDSLIDSPLQMSGEILTLRSMAQAVYQQENIGHFGLGFELYAHFTSPIRRYADLVVHRLIKYYLFKKEYQSSPYTGEVLDGIAQHISLQERKAMEAERDLYKIKSVRYMKPFEGQVIEGTISSIAGFGIFVEDPNTGIEIMIRYTDMPEYIVVNEDELIAYNKSKTKIFQIGKPITIRVSKVNVERGFIDGELVFYE